MLAMFCITGNQTKTGPTGFETESARAYYGD
jgi:hypothetical protein